MDTCRPCGCKGCRTCLLCESEFGIAKASPLNVEFGTYVYCPLCNKAWPGWGLNEYERHPNHIGNSIEYPGVYVELDFLSIEEEKDLMDGIDNMQWDLSQSGRRKQNFGPKCNFKKRRLRLGNFDGFPKFTSFVQEKFKRVSLLDKFYTIEQCSLEYDPDRGASIDPHIDDCWIWGERIVTVNLLSDSVLTMTRNSKPNSYNISDVKDYESCVLKNGECYEVKNLYPNSPIIRIPMPKRSLLVLYGSARYEWEHQVLRKDISQRRVCLAYREFTPPYLEGGDKFIEGKDILKQAQNFF